MSREISPVGFRLPQDLKVWLKQQAVKNYRSMNAELIARLEQQRQQHTQLNEKAR